VASRDDKETARVGSGDQRYNHWTAVRNGLMNAHAGLFAQLPAIMKMLPDQIDQMKVFELIQIIPTPTRAALTSGNPAAYRVTDARIMRYLRNNSIFTFGKADRAKTSATFREILNAMWLFNAKFERARSKFNEIKAAQYAPRAYDAKLAITPARRTDARATPGTSAGTSSGVAAIPGAAVAAAQGVVSVGPVIAVGPIIVAQ
jgi:hypothetical protein